MLFGVDLRGYQIDDYQNFQFGTVPSINVLNPVYGVDIPLTSAPFRNYLITQKQAGTYLQDQIKLGNFTLVVSARNDWVSNEPGRPRQRSHACEPRRQQVQRARRTDL
jgi:iron complex outermembrane recepter protein